MSRTAATAPLLADVGAGDVALLTLGVVAVIALAVLFVAAVVSIARAPDLTDTARVLWVLAVVVFQFFGPITWFVGRRQRRHDATVSVAAP